MMTPSPFNHPGWSPRVSEGSRVLIVGASGGLGTAVTQMLIDGGGCTIGAHGASNKTEHAVAPGVIALQQYLKSDADCVSLIDRFVGEAGGIDALVLLNGRLNHNGHWKDMPEEAWNADLTDNLGMPFFLARQAMKVMRIQGTGGRIIFNGTESALHGGSSHSMPYAAAKQATECLVQGMAREGAPDGILVNGVRLGFIKSGFHERWSDRDAAFLEERAQLVPLKRGGEPEEAAALIVYLLSGWGGFITGQMFALTGGDWL